MSDRTWFWRATFEDPDNPELIQQLRGGVIAVPEMWDEEAVEDRVKDLIWQEYGVQNSKCIVHVEPDNDHPGDES